MQGNRDLITQERTAMSIYIYIYIYKLPRWESGPQVDQSLCLRTLDWTWSNRMVEPDRTDPFTALVFIVSSYFF